MNRWINVVGNFESMNRTSSYLQTVYFNILKNGHFVTLAYNNLINDEDEVELRIDATFCEEDPGDMSNFKSLCDAVASVSEAWLTIKSGRSCPDPQN